MSLATRKSRFTLMPLIALGTLSLAVSIPSLANGRIHAAPAQRYQIVTVKPGDDLWTLASSRTPAGGDVQAMVDRVSAENHLASAALQPGQHLRIPI